ncbi:MULTISPECIES: RNA helicase [Bacillaceae]|uniref:RNA helicase n=1 Tax=Bacillaceae TaxID=186817 RepID=UPI0010325928|nr:MULTISPECIES: RNA helicase [Bacillaceae]
MDKLMIHAVAGAGKTSSLLEQLNSEKRVAVITYTQANQETLRRKLIKKFGHFPNNIHIFGLFEFLYGFCYRPLQSKHPLNGICFDRPPMFLKGYHNSSGQIYSNQLSRFLLLEKLPYLERIDYFFDHLYIDEVQDLTSDDFDWLMSLSELQIPVTLVGDFYQSTFASSRRGNKGRGVFATYKEYKNRFAKEGYFFDDELLVASHRCSNSVSSFVTDKLRIKMDSHRQDRTQIKYLEDTKEIKAVLDNDKVTKLFYQNSNKYSLNCNNWGNSKGLSYSSVCVVLNPTTLKKYPDNLHTLATQTLRKFYVACTRTEGDLYFIDQRKIPDDYRKY